jgi:hypothetical protein
MRDRRSVRYVTTHFSRLQGLRLVPLGVPFLLSAAWRARWLSWWPGVTGRGAAVWFFALLATAIAVSFPIRTWYEYHFGVVVSRGRHSGVGPIVASAAVVVLAIWFQLEFAPPVLTPLLVVGLVLALIGWRDLAVRPHYIAIGVACASYACSQVLGVPLLARAILLDLLVGISLIVAGVGDHRAFVHVFAASEEPHVRAV